MALGERTGSFNQLLFHKLLSVFQGLELKA